MKSANPFLSLITILFVTGCGVWIGNPTKPSNATSPASVSLPLVTQVVKAATPAGLRGNTASLLDSSLHPNDIASRFFSDGPTDLYAILGNIDSVIAGVNSSPPTCLVGSGATPATTAVAYTLSPFGTTQTFYAQCYSVGTPSADDPQLRLIGLSSDQTTLYIYSAYGAMRAAATVTPADGSKVTAATATTTLVVHAWLGVGYTNADTCTSGTKSWDGCSYGVVELWAQAKASDLSASGANAADGAVGPSSQIGFEMSAAGVGLGYCGVQLVSDGTNIYIEGSPDMSTSCGVVDTLCVESKDLSAVAGTCSVTSFGDKTQALGREAVQGTKQTFAASEYPSTPNIVINGSKTDSLWFGPTTPPDGTDDMSPMAN